MSTHSAGFPHDDPDADCTDGPDDDDDEEGGALLVPALLLALMSDLRPKLKPFAEPGLLLRIDPTETFKWGINAVALATDC
jgi:hypothetical protein